MSLLAPVLETEVLVLDESGAQNPSSWVRDEVSYVMNYRYGSVTKPGAPDTLTERIGDRMRSRLYEMCKTVEMTGKDFQKEVKEAQHHFKRTDA